MKVIFFLIFSAIFLVETSIAKKLRSLKTRFQDDIEALIRVEGFRSEVHQIETDDGFLLKLHRVLPKRKVSNQSLKPVFCMHGLLGTAADYLMVGSAIGLRKFLSFLSNVMINFLSFFIVKQWL